MAWKQTSKLMKRKWNDNTPAYQCVSSLEVIWLFIFLVDPFQFFKFIYFLFKHNYPAVVQWRLTGLLPHISRVSGSILSLG